MGYIFCCGFEGGVPGQFESSRVVANASPYVQGNYACRVHENFGGGYIFHTLETPIDEIWLGEWAMVHDAFHSTHAYFFVYLDNGSDFFTVGCDSGNLVVKINGSIVARGTKVITLETWMNLQFHIKVDDTVGKLQVKLNGLLEIDYTGDTKVGSNTTLVSIGVVNSFNFSYIYVDHIVASDSDWTDDVRIEALVPNSDDSVAWDRSTGADNYANVDDIPVDDANYNYTTVDGETDKVGLTDFSGAGKTPLFVDVLIRAEKNTGNTQQVKTVIDSNGTVVESSAIDLDIFFKNFHTFYALDPDGNSAWDDAALDALKIGYKAVI